MRWDLTTGFIKSTPPSQPNNVSESQMSVRPQSFLDFNEIWYVGRGRWVMHDGMQYDQIQGQVKVTSPWKSEIWPSSKAISSPVYNGGWQMITDS